MTKKKAIKILMAVSGCGNRSDMRYLFEGIKNYIAENPSNVDVTYRALCVILNMAKGGMLPPVAGVRAMRRSMLMRLKYGDNIGGTLIDDAEQ